MTSPTSRVVLLTEAFVQRAAPAQGRRWVAMDTKTEGFGLAVNRTSKSYFAMRRVHGKQRRDFFAKVGGFQEDGSLWTLASARNKAQQLLGEMAAGVDTVARRQTQRDEARRQKARGITLEGAITLTEGAMRAKARSTRTVADVRARLGLYLREWLDLPLIQITRQEVRERHAALAREIARGKYVLKLKKGRGRRRTAGNGQATANRTFQLFRNVWNRAGREHEDLGPAPVHSVNWFDEGKHRAALQPEGLADWFKAVNKLENGLRRDYLLFTLFSGMRRQSVAEMRWEDVDLKGKTLRVPRPKGGERRAFDLPLSDAMVEILRRREAEHSKLVADVERMKPWVWPAPSASGHIAEPREEGVPGTIHDLRRVFITVATHRLKLHPFDVKLLVNHALRGDVTMGYVTPDVEHLRAPMQKVTDGLRALCEPAPASKGKVVPMQRRQKQIQNGSGGRT